MSFLAVHNFAVFCNTDCLTPAMQNMPKHDLLTIKEEAALSQKIQDWVLLQNKFKDMSKKLGQAPSTSEWAAAFKMDEEDFKVRWKDCNRVSCTPLSLLDCLAIWSHYDASLPCSGPEAIYR